VALIERGASFSPIELAPRLKKLNRHSPGRYVNEIEASALLLRHSIQEHEIMAQSQYGGSDFSGKATDLKDQATDQIKKVAGQVEGYANDAMDKLRDTGAGEVAGNLKGAVDKSVKDQPMATLALAAAIGFVLGAIWKA
jgi:ElaB/YqjD/DUF883 family membrane-anchored ribosome-binding protein